MKKLTEKISSEAVFLVYKPHEQVILPSSLRITLTDQPTKTMKLTIESATASVETIRKNLADAITRGENAMALDHIVNELAEAEGKLNALEVYTKAEGRREGLGREVLIEKITRGADDCWSGRNNDARRAYFDGFRETAGEIIRFGV